MTELQFAVQVEKNSKNLVKNTYLNTIDWKNNAKKPQNMYFLLQNHCKTLIFEQYFERVLKYEVLFSWLNGNLQFRSKEHNKKRVKTTYLNTIDWKIKEKT